MKASSEPRAGVGAATSYIAFLRGINVGAHMVKMARLRELFSELGFTDVWTYMQSGNVFFTAPEQDRQALTKSIEERLEHELGFAVPVILRTLGDIERIVRTDPFKHVDVTPDTRLCVAFTTGLVPSDLALPMHSPKNDMSVIAAAPHELFMTWTIINGRPPAFTSFPPKLTDGPVTTRFFQVLVKMLAAAEKRQSERAAAL